ncbi:MAG: SDR family oxidoreductase [Alphaproteobacteria bacterium]|mgnify:CR=1 FL=1|jgi:NAD(P)-dependent dehydrogenase (short-subunit alcohol dehydrogenase family)|nr:SDR family oxidoreductase [Alphaproteobacteria bacterium]
MAEGFVQDKVILVTGAGRGIGAEVAKLAAAEGAKVVVNDLGASVEGEGADASPAQGVVDEIAAAGGEAVLDGGSIAEWDDAQAMVAQAVDTFGRIDGVINVAGILRDRIFHKMSPEEWYAVLGVHLTGYFHVARAAAEHFRKQSSGSMVHFTSNSGLVGNVGQANYAAAKMGVVGLSKSIALDMERYHVRSNIVSPSAFTRMIETIPTNDPTKASHVERQKRMLPEKIAPMCVYLMSDAAEEVSGQVFYCRANEIMLMSQSRPMRSVHRDGGWTCQTVHEHAIPALKANFYPLDRGRDVFTWDPI